jgi:RNA polymerase sigma factor (TIGR02999 family)
MQEPKTPEVTDLLASVRKGDQYALNQLLPLVYDELGKIASSYLHQEYQQRTLQTSDLVHEAYLKLARQDVLWQDRAHFYGIAANAMRQILVDYARRRNAAKRGGADVRVTLNENILVSDDSFNRLLLLDDALNQLQKFDDRLRRVVELRYFGGMTVEETAEVLSVSPRTVKDDWRLAKAWLHKTLSGA